MAEVVAGLWAAEEVISTSVYAGIAGYAVAKPTMPVKASCKQIGLAAMAAEPSSASLARSHHTLTIVGNRAYIFGGQIRPGYLASNELHVISFAATEADVPDYQVLPTIASDYGEPVPSPRTKHSACAIGPHIVIYGGSGQDGQLADDNSILWLFDTQKLTWQVLKPETHPERTPPARSDAILLAHDDNIVLFGGRDGSGNNLQDLWHFNTSTKTWNALPGAPVATTSATIARDMLYLISPIDNLSSQVHSLAIELYAPQPPEWKSVTFPTNPLTPGPGPRKNAGLLPMSTGHGRNFLLYLFGDKLQAGQADPESVDDCSQWSDMWTYQLPSSDPEMQGATDFSNAVKPAKMKDQIREKVGAGTGTGTWGKVETQSNEYQGTSTSPHPDSRSNFASDIASDQKTVLLWGGIDEKGDVLGDGWLIRME